MQRTPERQTKVKHVVENRQEGIVVLEDIHDPHNAMAVLRSCDCFGIQKIYFIFEKEKKFNAAQVGKLASSSANKWLDYQVFDSTEACLEQLNTEGYTSCATVLRDDAQSLFTFDFCAEKKLALLFGNEHSGLSQYAMDKADHLITIPMAGMIQSLNLSVTAAICLFEMKRQRQANFHEFQFHENDKEALFNKLIEL